MDTGIGGGSGHSTSTSASAHLWEYAGAFTNAGTLVDGVTHELRGEGLAVIRDKIRELLASVSSIEKERLPETLTLLHYIFKSIPCDFWELKSSESGLSCGTYFCVSRVTLQSTEDHVV